MGQAAASERGERKNVRRTRYHQEGRGVFECLRCCSQDRERKECGLHLVCCWLIRSNDEVNASS